MTDSRPDVYQYYDQLMKHLNGADTRLFDGKLTKFIYPRQFEIHLPSNHKKACDCHCPHCAGSLFDKTLGNWEISCLELLDNLKGAIPYHIYGGAYTEPLLNPYFMAFMAMTKKHGNHFGIHTNGTHLNDLESNYGLLTELNRLSTDDVDYLSISIDAGLPWSWGVTKGTNKRLVFGEILEGTRKACEIRKKSGKGHAIRLCYLISPESGNINDFNAIVSVAKSLQVDSLRFSIPFGNYNQSFEEIRQYKETVETPGNELYETLLEPILSKSKDEKPYIFYTGPEYTDIDKYNFTKCFYDLYQITAGADGYYYKCSTVATPTGKQCRVGKVSPDLESFHKVLRRNRSLTWDCKKMCFDRGLRGNRMALEINTILNAKVQNERGYLG